MAIDVGFKTEHPFQQLEVTRGDIILGSITFGFFFGFAVNVTWSAIRETRRARRFSAYIFMIWLEIAAVIQVTSWGYLSGHFPPGIGVFLMVIICWICQVQCLMLIIVNRLCILYSEPRQRLFLKASVAGLVGCVSIATGCICEHVHFPMRLRPILSYDRADGYIQLNHWWDLLDLSLNILFIRMVKTRLVQHGLKKYDKVMRFNEYIIVVSIGMDILLLGVTFLRNNFHPVVYIVKLQIEMTMSRLLIKVARSTGINVYNEEKGGITSDSLSGNKTTNHGVAVQIQTQVFTHAEGPDEYELDRRDHKSQALQEAESVNSSGEIIKVSPV
ncbi:uncharacterized protein EV420DRAFT_1529167 [Desarmillaria tabescens]|uniref:Integral membrane protein n=1 Tax=Armillaria tabescens TaxID=1929756 RepID=A0AA39TQX6_ARMTA|nr:uncharacterized protein EV420DRAFT_1529167 [Desarmillaria tabescens]KAK0460919.1 hypothetical protein EV420DRAFT_1529167 [Desarmillaria tabescens]